MKKVNLLYYIAISGVFYINLIMISDIFEIDNSYKIVIYALIAILLLIKILLTKYSKKQLVAIAILGVVNLYITYTLDNYIFIINFLAFVGMKNIEIKKVIKIDIILKASILLIHTLIYFYDYCYNYENIANTLLNSLYGIRHSLYFTHPNAAGGVVVWLLIDIIYISKNKMKAYIISTIIMLFYYYFTISRTALVIYILFSILLIISKIKPKIFNSRTNFITKYLIDILAISSLVLVILPNIIQNSTVIEYIDKLLSSRLYYSQWALNSYGFNILPNPETIILEKSLIIDNFYIRCFVSYGIITYIMLSIKYKLLPKQIENLNRIILMLFPFYLFNELFCYNIGRAIPLLILANVIFNNKYEENIVGEDNERKS